MSDLQDLIHKTSMDCLSKGKQQEQERIIKLLEEQVDICDQKHLAGIYQVIALIKGEK